jgi:putative heme-binding domain-containing protein
MRSVLADESAGPERRRQAFEILSRAADSTSVPAFLALLDDEAYRSGVIGLLRRFSNEPIAPALLDRLERFPDRDRQRALGTLTVKASFAVPLLEAVLAGRVEKGSLTSFHVRQLRNLGDDRVNALVTRVWGQARETTAGAKSRIAALGKMFGEAPLWAYDARGGREVYQKVCSTCHALEEREEKPGPDLAGSGRNGVEYFLESILDPNAVVGEDYQITVVLKNDGTVISGLIQNESDSALTIRTVDETVVVAKADIAGREKQTASLMPEGLFDTLSEREVIELLKYLTSAR